MRKKNKAKPFLSNIKLLLIIESFMSNISEGGGGNGKSE
jgi:hypothetical protein